MNQLAAVNTSLSFLQMTNNNWCIPLTGSVYLYGYLIPAIALFIFGLTFNPIALYYFATSLNFRRSAYSYYFSAIAVFDLLRLAVWCLFFVLDFKVFKLNFYSFECPTQIFTESVASSISVWLTVLLTVERCLVIYKPLQTFKETRRKRTLIVMICVIFASCTANSLVLQPGFYVKRAYRELSHTIVCHYEQSSTSNQSYSKQYSLFSPNTKRIYLLIIVIFRVVIPFVLLLTANIILFASVHETWKKSSKLTSTLLIRHGQHRRVTPMIFFSSCILLLTVSPRYLLQFYLNFYQKPPNCFLTHFASHLLKSLELSNYAFNVFVSIVSGKHGRHELFDMLFCRSISPQNIRFNNCSKLIRLSTTPSVTTSKAQHKQRFHYKNNEMNNPTKRIINISDKS
ncbi:unnamed protein product [Rotaria magnacalcarata]|uniref:G-protein coupled receptors family 1 profile domain-containing protein n=1 Tax=Rotaria magnacalcarata TaxID=392030 RepID=A0A815W4R9_9BILA|nr:unnamed protein product [Rotaria magnacalcarata]CAF1610946.1 unnamed protein product [Rotaria magnacalcarata]CAF2092893.1 unnamed protein product [Rotaria magnacalcarata]CAF2101571.1 unnamed protein product [Rotaria magnacalcarata]CAF2111066.1 unnamed protein product [Rotaria magnacalcarata]